MKITELLESKTVKAEKPRNFVAKHAKTGGAGQHKDKKRAEKQGDARHKNKQMAEGSDPASAKFGKYINKYFGQIYDYGDDGLDYLDNNAPFWASLFDKHNGDIDAIIANEPADVLKQAAIELKGVASDVPYEVSEQGVMEGPDQEVDAILSGIEKTINQRNLRGEDALFQLRTSLLDLALNKVGRDKRKMYEPTVMDVQDWDDAREFLSTAFRDAREQGVAEGYNPVESDYTQWEDILVKDGYRMADPSGADALDLVVGHQGGPSDYASSIRNILTYVKQNRAVLGKSVADRKTVKNAIMDIKNEYPQFYQAAQQPQGVAEGSVKELQLDLRVLSDEQFQTQYRMTKEQARAGLRSSTVKEEADAAGTSAGNMSVGAVYKNQRPKMQKPGTNALDKDDLLTGGSLIKRR
jgi:hypothetical protein